MVQPSISKCDKHSKIIETIFLLFVFHNIITRSKTIFKSMTPNFVVVFYFRFVILAGLCHICGFWLKMRHVMRCNY